MPSRNIKGRSSLAQMRDGIDSFAANSPARFAISAFALLLLVWTALFSLPIASNNATVTPFPQALFTAVSTICVTGLSVVDMATYWSPFGHVVVLLGSQIGGIGVLTLASVMGLVVARKLGLRQRLMAASDTNPLRIHRGPISEGQAVRLGEVGSLLLTVALSSLAIEAVLAVLLLGPYLAAGRDVWTAMWQSFYTATSAFTNTGFMPSGAGMTEFQYNPWVLIVIMIGVFLGSIGYPVIFALTRHPRRMHQWSVHVKLTLVTTIVLLLLGGLIYMLLEWNNAKTLGAVDPWMRPLWALFFSGMTRSGGFATFNPGDLNGSSKVVTDMLMFVGGGSASTAGGIKVTTLAVLFLAAVAEAKGRDEIEVFERRIPQDVLRLAVSVLIWGATTVAAACILLAQFTSAPLDDILFDVISAFATTGLSSGLTAHLSDPGLFVLSATMFAGRVGTVTVAAALAASQTQQWYRHAEERPIVG